MIAKHAISNVKAAELCCGKAMPVIQRAEPFVEQRCLLWKDGAIGMAGTPAVRRVGDLCAQTIHAGCDVARAVVHGVAVPTLH